MTKREKSFRVARFAVYNFIGGNLFTSVQPHMRTNVAAGYSKFYTAFLFFMVFSVYNLDEFI